MGPIVLAAVLAGFAASDLSDLHWQQLAREARIVREQERHEITKTRFWERIHLDGLWAVTQTGSRIYGLIGMHVTPVAVGRVQFFGPPGIILLSVPSEEGRVTRLAYTWGVSVELFEFKLPGTDRRAKAHVNVTKAWTFGGDSNVLAARSGLDVAGLSITLVGRK
jgi:hypothetical protein